MIHFSTLLYELSSSRLPANTAVSVAPTGRGMEKSMRRAMAPPRISAMLVMTEAPKALSSTTRPMAQGKYSVMASAMHLPVTIPRCAALCCNTMSIKVERLTIHSRA